MQHRDPVCGMTVESTSIEAAHGDHSHYFCSTTCRDRFQANPEAYHSKGTRSAAARGEELERHEPPRTVKGNFAAPKFGSAGSGGAEYELLPEQHDKEK
jgi:YHS domain-containing protein